ncbi:hypothetical protein [Actinoplanes sp. NPDC051411]|uniref:hypothetical protein n=1 Tax=Actinoplanes sp. NPDC051411 TaxID=3155522 RepID=UPI0034297D2E
MPAEPLAADVPAELPPAGVRPAEELLVAEPGTLARAAFAPGMAEIGRDEPSMRSGTRPELPGLTGRADPLARLDEPEGDTAAEPLAEPPDGAETDAEPLAEPPDDAETDAEPLAEPAGRTRADPVAVPGGVGLTDAEPLTGAEGPAGAEPPAPGTVARPLAPLVGALAGLSSSSDGEAGAAQSAPAAGGGGGA